MLKTYFQNLGGLYVKLGQIIALRRDILPEEICSELSTLLEEVPPFAFKEVEEIITSDFQASTFELFKIFEQKPIAAASIGQVHAAQLHNGTKVVVKVKRPRIETYVNSDLKLLKGFATFGDIVFFFIRIRMKPLVNEFEQWIMEELDYKNEARNIEEFSKYKTNLIPIFNIPLKTRVPQIYPEYCSSNVLVMEYIEGKTINKLIKARKNRDQTEYQSLVAEGYNFAEIGRELNLIFQKQIFLDGYFNADPHPANIIATKNNEIIFIDLGLVGRLNEKQRVLIFRFGRALALLNKTNAIDAFIKLMQVPESKISNVKKVIGKLMEDLQNIDFSNTSDYADMSFNAMFGMLKSMNSLGLQVPPEVAKGLRAVLTSDSIVTALNPGISSEEVLQDMNAISLAASYLLIKSRINDQSLTKLMIRALDFIDNELVNV